MLIIVRGNIGLNHDDILIRHGNDPEKNPFVNLMEILAISIIGIIAQTLWERFPQPILAEYLPCCELPQKFWQQLP